MTVTTVTGAGQPFPTGTAAAARESFAPQETLTADELFTLTTANRQSSARGYLMCPPSYFAVTYAINPWMRRSSGRAGSSRSAWTCPSCTRPPAAGNAARSSFVVKAHSAHTARMGAWGPADQAWPERSQASSIMKSGPRRRTI